MGPRPAFRNSPFEGCQRAAARLSSGTVAPLVVVIEDDPATVALLTDLLTDAGYAVEVPASPSGALAAIKRLRPAAILLDLRLPYRPGAALLAALRADPATAAVPVIVVSAVTEALSPEWIALANAVIAKPFDIEVLLDALHAAGCPIGAGG